MFKYIYIIFVALIPWGSSFSEKLSLGQVYTLTLAHNPELKLSKEGVQFAEGEQKKAFSEFLPDVDFSSLIGEQRDRNYSTKWLRRQFNGTNITGFNPKVDKHRKELRAGIEYNIFSGFGHYHDYKSDKAKTDIAKLDYEIAESDTLYEVTRDYFNILILEKTTDLYKKLVTIYERHKKNASQRYQLKDITELQLLDSENKYLEALSQHSDATHELISLKQVLNQKLGRALDSPVSLNEMPQDEKLDLKDLNFYLDQMQARNLKLQKAKFETLSSKHLKKASYAEMLFMPHVKLSAAYAYQGPEYTDLEKNWEYGVAVKIPLFDGLENLGSQKKAEAGLQSSLIKEKALSDQSRIEMQRVHQKLQSFLIKENLYSKKLRYAELQLSQTQIAYENKTVIRLKLLEAEASLTRSKIDFLQNERDMKLARLELQKMIGEPIWNSKNN